MIEIKISTIELFVALIVIGSASIQLVYYLFFYTRIAFIKRKKKTPPTNLPVSVIICAKNEEYNLKKNLRLVLEQQYPEFEVIVVNDCSQDDTDFYVTRLQKDYSHLRYTKILEDPKFKHNKKLAVTIGIKAAKYDTFVFIDADCYPVSNTWLSDICAEFSDKKHIILGYGGYEMKSGFLDKLVRYDTCCIALQYMTFAHAGIPYMGVGRNLAYSRDMYLKSSRFVNHSHMQSGDDDLFIAEVATAKNTAVCLVPTSFTRSEQVSSFREWRYQKQRHLTTSRKYSFLQKMLLILEPFSRVLFYCSVVAYAFCTFQNYFVLAISLIAARMLLCFVTSICAMNTLHEKKLLVYSLIFDSMLPIIITFLHIQNRIRTHKKRW